MARNRDQLYHNENTAFIFRIIDLPWKRSEAPRPGINFAQWWSANRNVSNDKQL